MEITKANVINNGNFNLCLLIAFGISFFVSIAAGCILFIFLLFYFKKASYWGFVFPLVIISTIAFTQYSTPHDGDYDIIRYYTFYHTFSKRSLSEAALIIGLNGEYFFYTLIYLLSQIIPDDPRVFSFFFSMLTGGILLNTYHNLSQYCKTQGIISQNKTTFQIFIWIIGFVGIISIVNYTNIVRQFFSVSLFLCAYSRFLVKKRYVFLLVLSLLSHWTMGMYILPFVLFKSRPQLIRKFWIIALIGGLLNISSLFAHVNEKVSYFLEGEILGVDKTLMVVLLVSLCITSVVISRLDSKRYIAFLFFLILCLDLLFLTRSSMATRIYYVFVELLAVVLPIIVVNKKVTYSPSLRFLVLFLFVIIFAYNVKQILLADFSYLIFSQYSVWDSIMYIFSTPFPSEIIS